MQRRLGRPKGSLGGLEKVRWEPKIWKIVHDMVVMLHINGKTNKAIASIVEKHELWVGWVLQSKKAKEIIDESRVRLYKDNDVVERYRSILDKGVDRMALYLNNDELAKATPGAMFDRAARAVEMIEKRFGNLKTDSSSITVNDNRSTTNAIVYATEENVDRLLSALDKSNKVTELHREPNRMLKVVND